MKNILELLNQIDRKSCTDRVNGLLDLAISEINESQKLRTPIIKTKNIGSYKYKKNKLMLNNFGDFNTSKIDFVSLYEQGNDLVVIGKEESVKEYALIKVYFK